MNIKKVVYICVPLFILFSSSIKSKPALSNEHGAYNVNLMPLQCHPKAMLDDKQVTSRRMIIPLPCLLSPS